MNELMTEFKFGLEPVDSFNSFNTWYALEIQIKIKSFFFKNEGLVLRLKSEICYTLN